MDVPNGDPRHRLGVAAEDAVAARLAHMGWRLLERRWRCPSGELDLVCLDPGGTLVGIEVRARSSGRAGSAIESVSRAHVGRLRRALATYAAGCPGPVVGLRLDLAAIAREGSGWSITMVSALDAW